MERPAPLLLCEVVGGTSVSIGDDRLAAEGELVFALALYLGLNAGEEIQRDDVAHLLWPQHDDEAARHCLRQLLYRLRVLGLVVNARGDALDLSPECVRTDYAGLLASEPSREAYLAVLRFDVLPGYMPTFSQPFVRWVEEFRERLGLRLRNGLVACISDARSRGRYRDVAQLARHCLALDPLNEEATLGLAEATALVGSKVAAVQMLEAYRSDIGDAPGLRLQADLLRRRIAERLNVYGQPSDDVPMIGREDAMEYVLRGVHELSSGRARSLLITGEAGVGKTRLLGEFARVTAMHNVRTVFFRCHQGWREQPLAAITDLVTTLLQLPGALGASPDAMSALRELTTALPRRSDIGMYAGDADAMLANLRWSVLDLFEAVMQERKLVLLVDNVQWLDELSEHFLDYVVSRCAKRPLYLVMTSREGGDVGVPDTKRPLLATEHRLVLKPLDDDASRALVRHVVELADRELSDASVDSCVRRCGGNPYFLSELARFYMVSGPDSEPPVTLRMFIEYRLSKVSSSARRALEVVAILGSFATLRRMGRILQRRSIALLDVVEELLAADLVRLCNERCECRHDIVRELVESGMSHAARRTLHLRCASELGRDATTTLEAGLLLQCGKLLLNSGDTARAPRGALMLSRRLLRLGAAEAAAEISSGVAAVADESKTRMRANLMHVRALRAQGRWGESASTCRRLLESFNSEAFHSSRIEVEIYAAESAIQLGPLDPSSLHRLVDIANDLDLNWVLRLMAARLVITIADNKWDAQLASRVASTIEAAPELTDFAGVMRAVSKTILATMTGDHATARRTSDRLVLMRRQIDSLALQHRCTRIAAHCYFRLGDVDRAKELFTDSLSRSTSSGRINYAVFDHAFLALTCLQRGELAEANEHLMVAAAQVKQIGLETDFAIGIQILQLEARVEAGDAPILSSAVFRRLRLQAIDLDPRFYQALLAVRLFGSRRSRSDKDESLREELRQAIDRFSGCGWQDFPVCALAQSFLRSANPGAARSIVTKYLNVDRPEKGRLRPSLERLAMELGLSQYCARSR